MPGGYFDASEAVDLNSINASASRNEDSPVDDECQLVCRKYLRMNVEEAERLRKSIDLGCFLHFAHRMAVKALRTEEERPLLSGLAAVSLDNLRTDVRESLSTLAMLEHVARRIGVDFPALCNEIASKSSFEFQETVKQLLEIAPKPLSAWGLREVVDENGPTIVYDPFVT